jgi:hypothetical protein
MLTSDLVYCEGIKLKSLKLKKGTCTSPPTGIAKWVLIELLYLV